MSKGTTQRQRSLVFNSIVQAFFFQIMELHTRIIQSTPLSFEWFGREVRPNGNELAQEMQKRGHRHRTGIKLFKRKIQTNKSLLKLNVIKIVRNTMPISTASNNQNLNHV
jgi:sulfatase maturation enzyme AslB (radical SAM superfamily)